MCDSTIATCPVDTTLNYTPNIDEQPIGAPVCSTETPLDGFSSESPFTLDQSVSQGMMSYYAGHSGLEATSAIDFPRDQSLALVDYQEQLPPEILATPHVAAMIRLQTEFQVPVSFRVVNVQLSNGQTMPQLYFYRTADEGAVSVPGGRGPNGVTGTPGGSAPRPSTVGMTVGLVGMSAAIVAFDHLLLDELVDRDIMPEEARIPVMFSTMMTSHYALYRAGIVETSPVAGLRHIPTFFGFQILANLLLTEVVGMEPGDTCTDFLGITLAAMPFAYARMSPAVAEALGLRVETGALAALGRGGTALSLGAAAARVLGMVAIVDIGSRVGVNGIGRIVSATSGGDYDNNMRLWNLVRLTQDIINQERVGEVPASMLGMLFTFAATTRTWYDGEFDTWYHQRMDDLQSELVTGSDQFGNGMHQAILQIISQNTTVADGHSMHSAMQQMALDPTNAVEMHTDWQGVARDLRRFYGDSQNEDNIENGYNLVDEYTAPLTTSGIASLIQLVDDNGNIQDVGEFRDHFHRHLRTEAFQIHRRMNERSLALGLSENVNGVLVSHIPADPSQLTFEQRTYLDGEALRDTVALLQTQMLISTISDE